MGFSVEVTQVAIWALYVWRFSRWGPLMPSDEEAGMSEQDVPTVDFDSTTDKRLTRPMRGPHD